MSFSKFTQTGGDEFLRCHRAVQRIIQEESAVFLPLKNNEDRCNAVRRLLKERQSPVSKRARWIMASLDTIFETETI